MWPKQSVMEPNKISGLNKNVGNILVCLRVDDDAEQAQYAIRHTPSAIRLEVCQWKSLQLLKLISFITSWKYLHVPEMLPAYLPQTVPAIKLFDDPFIHSSMGPRKSPAIPIMCRPVALLPTADCQFQLNNIGI